jgi:BirA family transcriptional regulator, biotin operon repressor / biotin---[acetyl-CoA-carboxylase] ligase
VPKEQDFHLAFKRALADVSPRIVTLDETRSTNDDARALARAGAPHLTVVVADTQSAARGRLGRTWIVDPNQALNASWIVRPERPVDAWTVIPLLAGVAVADAVKQRTGVEARLKWPNDVVVGARKLAGILTEAEVPEFVVVGLGMNVLQQSFDGERAESATSIAIEGGTRLDRPDLLAKTLTDFAAGLSDPAAAFDRYRELCVTIGQTVRVERATGEPVSGFARAIDDTGALVVETAAGETRIASGDVVHLRPEPLPD